MKDYGIKGLINPEALAKSEEVNSDSYGGACVQVAINVMKFLDTFDGEFNIGYSPDMTTTHGIICKCDNQGGITGFMAGAARNIVAFSYRDGWKFWIADVVSSYDIKDGKIKKDVIDKHIDTLAKSDIDVDADEVRKYVDDLVARYCSANTKDSTSN